MHLRSIVIGVAGVAILTASACDSEDDAGSSSTTSTTSSVTTATSTSAGPPLPAMPTSPLVDAAELDKWMQLAQEYAAPCLMTAENTQMFSPQCSSGSGTARTILSGLAQRLVPEETYPLSRTAMQGIIDKIDRWNSVCIGTAADTPERRQCIATVLVPADFMYEVQFAWHDDRRNAGLE